MKQISHITLSMEPGDLIRLGSASRVEGITDEAHVEGSVLLTIESLSGEQSIEIYIPESKREALGQLFLSRVGRVII